MNDPEPTLTQRTIFSPVYDALWDGWRQATDYLQGLSDAKLWQAAEWANALGRTNCGWAVYRMKDDLVQFIAWEQNRREQAKVHRTDACHAKCFGPGFGAMHHHDCPSAKQGGAR